MLAVSTGCGILQRSGCPQSLGPLTTKDLQAVLDQGASLSRLMAPSSTGSAIPSLIPWPSGVLHTFQSVNTAEYKPRRFEKGIVWNALRFGIPTRGYADPGEISCFGGGRKFSVSLYAVCPTYVLVAGRNSYVRLGGFQWPS